MSPTWKHFKFFMSRSKPPHLQHALIRAVSISLRREKAVLTFQRRQGVGYNGERPKPNTTWCGPFVAALERSRDALLPSPPAPEQHGALLLFSLTLPRPSLLPPSSLLPPPAVLRASDRHRGFMHGQQRRSLLRRFPQGLQPQRPRAFQSHTFLLHHLLLPT